MFVPIPNRRGGTRAPQTVALGIVRAKGRSLRLDIFISKDFHEAIRALGLDNGTKTVDIGIGLADTPDAGLMRIAPGVDFKVQTPYSGKPYYRLGFYLSRFLPQTLAEQLFSEFSRTWLSRDKIRVTEQGELLIALPEPLCKVLPRALLSLIKKGGVCEE